MHRQIIESALLPVAGTVLIVFSDISLGIYRRPPTLCNPALLIEALALAGLVLFGLGARGIHRVHRALSGNEPFAPCCHIAA